MGARRVTRDGPAPRPSNCDYGCFLWSAAVILIVVTPILPSELPVLIRLFRHVAGSAPLGQLLLEGLADPGVFVGVLDRGCASIRAEVAQVRQVAEFQVSGGAITCVEVLVGTVARGREDGPSFQGR